MMTKSHWPLSPAQDKERRCPSLPCCRCGSPALKRKDCVPPGKKKIKSDEIDERKVLNDENNEKNSQQKTSYHPLSPSVDAPFPEIYEVLA